MADPKTLPELLWTIQTLCESQGRRFSLACRRLRDCGPAFQPESPQGQRTLAAIEDIAELSAEIHRVATLALKQNSPAGARSRRAG
jgi:hypothetical protein